MQESLPARGPLRTEGEANRSTGTAAGGLVVGAALVDDLTHPTTVLAARRTAPPALAGGWELPGGKVEPGETPDGAWPLSDTHRMLVRLAVVTAGEPAPLEDHDALRVLTADTLEDVAWLPADLPVVRALRDVVGDDPKP